MYTEMDPTNDPVQLEDSQNCPYRCGICFKALCLQAHEMWKCRCGHMRGQHLAVHFYYGGIHTMPNHPHPCHYVDCDCEALVYELESDLITNEEAIRGLCEVIEDLV